MCPPFVIWQNPSRYSIFAHTCCSMKRWVTEKRAMSLVRSSGGTCGTGGRKTEALIFLYKKKNRMAWGQAIVVASEAAPHLLQRAWAEMDYMLDVCHVRKGEYVEHYWGMRYAKQTDFFSLHRHVACYNPSRRLSVPILLKCEPERTWIRSVRKLHHRADHFYSTVLHHTAKCCGCDKLIWAVI